MPKKSSAEVLQAAGKKKPSLKKAAAMAKLVRCPPPMIASRLACS
jgi:hypothetical protein